MTLARGDVLRYQALKKGPLADYLLALDNFVQPAPNTTPAAGEPTAKPKRR